MSVRGPLKALLARRPLRTRTLLQMEAVECGAASLGSILGYHGRYDSLEELRVACGVSRDGVTARNIIRAARNYGLEASGFKRELEDLRTTALPAILFWNFNHFVVLEGFRDDQVFLNDPATGPRTVTWEELDEAYTGVVLVFSPGPEFRREGREPSLVGTLARWLKGSESAVAFAALAGLLLVVPGLLLPTFTRIFVDQILIAGLHSWVVPVLLGLGFTALLQAGLVWTRSHFLLRLDTKLAVSGSGRFFWHVLRLPVEFYTQRYAGEISSRVSLNQAVASLLSGRLASSAIDLLTVAFFGAVMLLYSVPLTLVAVVVVLVNLGFLRLIAQVRVDGNRRVLQEAGKLEGALTGGLGNIETLKATSREPDLFSALAGHQAKLEVSSQELDVKSQALLAVPYLLSNLAFAVVLVAGGYLVVQGHLTMGMLVAFQVLMVSFMAPARNLLGLGAELQEMVGNVNRLDDVLRYPADPQVSAELVPPPVEPAPPPAARTRTAGSPRLAGRVEFRGVTFGYSRLSEPLIRDFDLVIEPGARVALVGPSGCGKSTLSKLVCRLYQPWEGEILLDGIPLDEVPRDVFSSSVAFVDQDLTLFQGTIRDNLTLWDSTIPDDAVIQAAKDADIHLAISGRPGGYRSPLDEGGSNFSGGQRQRLDIARALVGNPRILVLDEATSALDTVTEEKIDRAIRRRGCTCIIVAHRLSTIRDADEILVLEQGQVVQRGTHEQLVGHASGAYLRLLEH